MLHQRVEPWEWRETLAQLAFLASCAAAATSSRPKASLVTAVIPGNDDRSSELAETGQGQFRSVSSEVVEFMTYPVTWQRQMLEYGRQYIKANFEAKITHNP